jgi:hypothetical protein
MSKAFSNITNIKSDNQIFNRAMTNFNENPSYKQFDANQLNNSLQLLSQTDNLTIEPVANNNFSSLDDNLLSDNKREPVFDFSMKQFPLQNPTAKPILNNQSLDMSTQLPSIKNQDIPLFSEFVIPREPALDFSMGQLPLQNPTAKPILNNGFLDMSTQLKISNMNKNINPSSTIVSSNEIKEPINKFQGVALPQIPYDEYKKPTALFNNFNDDGRSDIIREYIVHINSIDRDIIRYPSPFNFLIRCAPLSGDPNASISRTFENIRYIKIETAVLPLKYYLIQNNISTNTTLNAPDYLPNKIKDLFMTNLPSSNDRIIDELSTWVIIYAKNYTNSDNSNIYSDEYAKYNGSKVISYTQLIPDSSDKMTICYECIYKNNTYTTYKYELSNISLAQDKYTILYLNDINDISNYSTSKNLSNAFNVLYPDFIESNSLYVDCNYVEKIYKYSNLGSLERMLINLTNSLGKQLTTNIVAQDDKLSNFDSTICTCTTNKSDGSIIRDYKCVCSYIRHPRYVYHQVNFMFKFGIVETDMNIRAFN